MYIKQWLGNLPAEESSIIFCLTLINLGDSGITVQVRVPPSGTRTSETRLSAVGRAEPVKLQTLEVSVMLGGLGGLGAVTVVHKHTAERQILAY